MKIAIIGTGISGLGASYLLNKDHDITVYEKNTRLGGHSRTIDVTVGGERVPVDTGFIVFNDWNYPNLLGLFKAINVPYEKSDMSFGVSIKNGWLEYSSNNLFAQSRNIVSPKFYKMLRDIITFNKKALEVVEKQPDITLAECLECLGLGAWFRDYYILAMGAAIWSCPIQTIMKFPAKTFLQFFKNHGLLSINDRPQWYTVSGGSREYINRLTAGFSDKIVLNSAVETVSRSKEFWLVREKDGNQREYDAVIFACHADEALKILQKPSDVIQQTIGAFDYQENHVVVHTDQSFMPRNKKCWASWVYLSEQERDEKSYVSLSYWMNNLQNFESDHPVIVTLNPGRRPQESLILDEVKFTHPIFDQKAIAAQDRIDGIQGEENLYFCGAYQRYGFHEDGLLSAVNVARKIGSNIPWA